MIDRQSFLWPHLSEEQRVLAEDGSYLVASSRLHSDTEPTDYSYMVFPFAKMYEGFLKQMLLDTNIITEEEYKSHKFRVGKVLCPQLAERLGEKSAYRIVQKRWGQQLAETLWNGWTEGRNNVFHYYPHNVRRLSRGEAEEKIRMIISAMETAVKVMKGGDSNRHDCPT